MGGRFIFLAALWLFNVNAAGEGCPYSDGGLPCPDLDEEGALQLLQKGAARGHGGTSSGTTPAGHAARLVQDMGRLTPAGHAAHVAGDGTPSSADMGRLTKGAKAVKALEVAQSAADREQWPDIEQMIHSVSSVVTQSVEKLSSALTSGYTAIEGLANNLLKECKAAKESLLQSVNATSGKVEDRLAELERRANKTLDAFMQHFGPLDRELHKSSKVATAALATAGQDHLASRTSEAFGGVTGWAETCIVAVGNVSEAMQVVGQRSQGSAVHKLQRLNATLDLLLDRVKLFVDTFEAATSNATQNLIVVFSARLPSPAALLVNRTLIGVRDKAKSSGETVVRAAQEVTSGIGEAYAKTVKDEGARGSGRRPQVGFSLVVAAVLAYLGPCKR
mmetsp:Transcript_108002/g.287551  ORF Transcript_108002/g.287551 Transcript_108002/m.287551 type:complete len:391 (-) Transcript_108002:68-1240(-)